MGNPARDTPCQPCRRRQLCHELQDGSAPRRGRPDPAPLPRCGGHDRSALAGARATRRSRWTRRHAGSAPGGHDRTPRPAEHMARDAARLGAVACAGPRVGRGRAHVDLPGHMGPRPGRGARGGRAPEATDAVRAASWRRPGRVLRELTQAAALADPGDPRPGAPGVGSHSATASAVRRPRSARARLLRSERRRRFQRCVPEGPKERKWIPDSLPEQPAAREGMFRGGAYRAAPGSAVTWLGGPDRGIGQRPCGAVPARGDSGAARGLRGRPHARAAGGRGQAPAVRVGGCICLPHSVSAGRAAAGPAGGARRRPAGREHPMGGDSRDDPRRPGWDPGRARR